MWQGSVVSIHVTRAAGQPMETVAEAKAVRGRGLEGDRYFLGTGYYSDRPSEGGRDVTLIETETLEALAALGIKLAASESRRNIATVGVPLNRLVRREFRVGAVRLRGTRLCEPCRYLEGLTQAGVRPPSSIAAACARRSSPTASSTSATPSNPSSRRKTIGRRPSESISEDRRQPVRPRGWGVK